MFKEFSTWLSGTPLSSFEQNAAWVIPVLQSIHILAVATVMGAVGLLELRALGLAARSQSLKETAWRLSTWASVSLAVLAGTGALMVIGEPARALLNPTFGVKMALLGGAIILTALAVYDARNGDPGLKAPVRARVLLTSALVLWTAVLVAGRWIAYLDPNV